MAETVYEAPAVTAVNAVEGPLIALSSVVNPQWDDEADNS